MNSKGQALVEYVLIIAVISVIAVALVNYFGGYLKDSITKTSCSIMGQEFVKGKKPGDGTCKDVEMDKVEDARNNATDDAEDDSSDTQLDEEIQS